MEVAEQIKAGDFTQLASTYAKYRPGYCETVIKAILGIMNRPVHEIDFVDVGAGTGIWTRQFAKQGCRSVTAVEPNDGMRLEGSSSNNTLPINWIKGSAENTSLPNQCADFVTMASSFHWADFDLATQEFHRLLKPNGYFAIVWNPRYLEESPLLQEIENHIYTLKPDLKRKSSGKSQYVDDLAKKLERCSLFEDIIHIEGFHTAKLSKQEYLGVWRSVNDIRSQLGEIKFAEFMQFIEAKIQSHSTIECAYQTRAWIVRKKKV